jgi:hypothetical protein
MIIDENIAIYMTLMTKLIKVNIQRFFWAIHFHPKNPIQNFIIRRRSYKLAQEMMKKLWKNKKVL